MKIKVMSDLHLEFSDIDLSNNGADVLVLSGDILLAGCLYDFPADYDDTTIVSKRHIQAIRFRNFLKYCSEDFAHVIYVAGNHEFYHFRWKATIDVLRDECAAFPNVHFLEKDSITIEDVIFVGGTLWTDCNNGDPITCFTLTEKINDFRLIKNDQINYQRLKPHATIVRHKETLEYIDVVASNAPRDKKIVVVGHHAPTFESVDIEYKAERELNGGYASDLSKFILDHPNIALWTCGHVHHAHWYYMGNTLVACNPRGYPSERQHLNFNKNFIIDLDDMPNIGHVTKNYYHNFSFSTGLS